MLTLSSYNDAIIFTKIPPPAEMGKRSTYPFEITLYTLTTGDHVIDLYMQNSNSQPFQQPQNKWSHLVPQWRFTDADGNVINQVTTTDTLIYDASGNIINVTGTAQFYYTDDIPTFGCNPLLIWATLSVSGYPLIVDKGLSDNLPSFANSKIIAVAPYYVNSLEPDYIKINRDGTNPMFDIYWMKTHIPHVVTLRGTTLTRYWCPNTVVDPIIFNIPETNEYGVSGGPVIRNLTNVVSSQQTWTPNNNTSYLSAFDENTFNTGGFLKGDVVSLTSINPTTITAGVSVYYPPATLYNVFVWVSNPDNNSIHRLYLPCISNTTTNEITSFIEVQKTRGLASDFVAYLTPPITSVYGMSLSGFSGVYGIAVDPCYNVWMTDSEKDCIYKVSSQGDILYTFSLKDMPSVIALEPTLVSGVDIGVTPAGISLDSIGNFWVSLYDSVSVLKFNALTNTLVTAINLGDAIPINDPYGLPYTDLIAKPTLAETDINNNVWVSYTNTLCSMLIKYDANGNKLYTINLPLCSNPMDILIDYNNDLWVSLTQHAGPPYLSGSVRKYNTSTIAPVLISAVSAVNPEYLTMNTNGTLWFTYGFNSVGYITSGGQISSFNVGISAAPSGSISTEKLEFNALEGIAADNFGRLFVINSLENTVYVYEGTVLKTTFALAPNNKYTWYNDSGYITLSASEWTKSSQAFGDWTGLRWQLKYTNIIGPTTLENYITGESNEFEIKDFSGLNIRRFNESWDAAQTIKSYAISPHIHDNVVLWDGLIGEMWGGSEIGEDSFGRISYEKIANFVANHNDIETSNVAQLFSLSKELDVPIDDYNLNYPPDLRRMMDIISVNQQKLWGSRCVCNLNITNLYETVLSGGEYVEVKRMCPRCGHEHSGNRGELFDATTYIVSAWTPFVIKDNWQGGNYMLVIPPPSCNEENICIYTYPLSAYYASVLPDIYLINNPTFAVVTDRFCFSNYISVFCKTQIAGVINWDDPYTTLSEQDSGLIDWYGSGETIEKLLNYTLHKGLGLVED